MGEDSPAGQQDAGSQVGAAYSLAQSGKPDMMPKYWWTGVLYWCAGGVRQRCRMRRRGYSAWGRDGQVPFADSQR